MMGHSESGAGLLSRFDILIMLGAIVTLFVALGTEPWWTLNGTTTSNLFNIQVSPFYVHIAATGLPITVPYAADLGSFTRTLVLLGFLAFFAASIRPTAWWRNLAVYFGLSSLAELYLSFILMYYWAETAFVSTFGILPPQYGTTTFQANVLGLDLNYYSSPLVTATFNIPFYLGFLSVALVMGRAFVRLLHDRAIQAITALFPGGGIHDVYLTPPYQRIWFSSRNQELNPMRGDPENVNDDEFLVSFEKLYDTVEPGGSLSIILPDWAANLADRFEKLMPQTGFIIEKTGTLYRTPGKPENELRFRKPLTESVAEAPPEPAPTLEQAPLQQGLEPPDKPAQAPPVSPQPIVESDNSTPPPVLEIIEKPAGMDIKMTRLERSMLKAAIRTIAERKQPVPYRELLNQVYMDLVDHKMEFDSARQIENTLLNHNGREIVLLEETEDNGARVVKKWWLGDQKISPSRSHSLPRLDLVKDVKPTLSSIKRIFRRSRKSRYTRVADDDDDVDGESTGA